MVHDYHDCTRNLNSLQHLRSSASEIDDRCGDSRRGFEIGCEESTSDDVAGCVSVDVVIEISRAVMGSVVKKVSINSVLQMKNELFKHCD